jgi:hypothetical protein
MKICPDLGEPLPAFTAVETTGADGTAGTIRELFPCEDVFPNTGINSPYAIAVSSRRPNIERS